MSQTNSRPPLSDQQRRVICRSSFLLFCFLPTLIIGYILCHPFSARDWEQLIQAEFGLETTIDSVDNVGPWQTVLRGVTLHDPEIGQVVQASEVLVRSGRRVHISINHPIQLSSSAVKRLAECARNKLIREPDPFDDLQVTAEQATLFDEVANRSLVTRQLDFRLLRDETGTHGGMEIQLASGDLPTDNSLSVLFHRSHDGSDRERYRLETKEQNLDCWLLASFIPELRKLGNRASFNGIVDTLVYPTGTGRETNAAVQGFFFDTELAGISLLPNQLTGIGKIKVTHCDIQEGQIHQLNMQIQCDDGTISAPLLLMAKTHLGLRYHQPILDLPTKYHQLHLLLEVDRGKMLVSGLMQKRSADGRFQEVIGEIQKQAVPLEDLARWLLPSINPNATSDQKVEFLSYFHLPEQLRIAREPTPADLSNYR